MEQQYTISGVKLAFPCKAYPTQLSMMSMIIKGIEKNQNCLLESPTGSGKSLALLCSTLGWQQGEREKRDKAEAEDYLDCEGGLDDSGSGVDDLKKPCTCSCSKTSELQDLPSTSTAGAPHTTTCPELQAQPSVAEGEASAPLQQGEMTENQLQSKQDIKKEDMPIVIDDDDDDDFQPSKKRPRSNGGVVIGSKRPKHQKGVVFVDDDDDEDEDFTEPSTNPHTKTNWQMKLLTAQAKAGAKEVSSMSSGNGGDKSPCFCSCHSSSKGDKNKDNASPNVDAQPKRIPRIYFGTRTHKQIAQIIREMGRTAYKRVSMSILGSREYTCVHPEVSKSRNKNEGCKELLDGKKGGSCTYFNNVHKMKHQWQIRDYGLTEAWDIEDLVAVGKRKKACPYFATRALREQADVIFCPYNYLIDPMIREAMEIDLKGQIVVLDEAHNIEDSSREAASLTVTAEQLKDANDELDNLLTAQFRVEHTRVMHTVGSSLLRWINDFSGSLRQNDFDRASRVWSGPEIVAALANMGISPGTLPTLMHHLTALTEDEDQERKIKELGPSLSALSAALFKGLFVIFNFLFKENMKYTKDYKIALLKTKAKQQFQNTNNRWINRRRNRESVWTLSLNFWCLNPAVAFVDFGQAVRTIILTSGTLSPMSSFASELGVMFPIQLEANHVINKSQVWISTLAMGPSGHSLNASYRNAETFAFQDDLGRVLMEVCKLVPYGVLCFLSSYSMMNKLIERWQATGVYEQLESRKAVMCEPRGGDKAVFDEQLRDFYDTIREVEENGLENHPITGVLMFAVCRGKISEGMDFADNNARAVLTVGIPFPNVRDSQVELKRQYNDQYSASRGLLTGSEWYEVQAYRALNQALGRCIRHKKDWGALLLIDERFSRNPNKYIAGLSKWVRGKVVHFTHARDAFGALSEFANTRMQASPDADTSVVGSSQPSSQHVNSPVTPMPSFKQMHSSMNTPFRFNNQTSSANTRQQTESTPQNAGNLKQTPVLPKSAPTQGRRRNVGQLFIPINSSASSPSVVQQATPKTLVMTPQQSVPKQTTLVQGTPVKQIMFSPAAPTPPVVQSSPQLLVNTSSGPQLFVIGSPPPPQTVVVAQPPPPQTVIITQQKAPQGTAMTQSLVLPNPPKQTFLIVSQQSAVKKSAGQQRLNFPRMTPRQKKIAPSPVKAVKGGNADVIDLSSPCKNGQLNQGVYSAPAKGDLPGTLGESANPAAPRGPTIANKLSKFCFQKREDSGDHATDHQTLPQGSRLNSCKDGTSKPDEDSLAVNLSKNVVHDVIALEDRMTIPPSDDEEEEEEEERRRMRVEDNGTPVLFDSEMGDSSNDQPGEILPLPDHTHQTGSGDAGTNKIRTNNHNLDFETERTTSCNNDNEVGVKTEQNVEQKDGACFEENKEVQRKKTRLSMSGIRSLSRRRNSDIECEPKEEGHQAETAASRTHISVRRSARTRRTPKKQAETPGLVNGDCCTDQINCSGCNTPLVSDLEGVECVPSESCQSRYLQDQLSHDGAIESGCHGNVLCKCLGREDGSTGKTLLVTDKANLRDYSPITSESGLKLNAYWSEVDSCCFQPIMCSVCNDNRKQHMDHSSTQHVIGYLVAAVGPMANQEVGKIYLIPGKVKGCINLLMRDV